MLTALSVLSALLFAGAVYMQPAHAQVQISQRPDFLFRSDRKRPRLRGRGEHASTAIGS